MTDLSSLMAAVERWMNEEGIASGPISDICELAGGTQNLLVRFRKGERDLVLRQPPRHAVSAPGETIRRETRVLAALSKTDVPHPALVATCPDDRVTGSAFFLMEAAPGFNVGMGMPPLHASDPAVRRAMGLQMVEVLARIGKIDPAAAGLADLGRPEGFLERQVARWRTQLGGYARYEGWPGLAALPGVDRLALWLEAHRPTTFQPGLMHGDYHLKNVLFSQDGPEITAVIDWELATVGDPLVDLGWLLATWPGPNGDITSFAIEPWDGFPRGDELVATYGALTGRDLSQMLWYQVFACYKMALILEGTHARACAGLAPQATGERLHGNALRHLARARRWLDEDAVSRGSAAAFR